MKRREFIRSLAGVAVSLTPASLLGMTPSAMAQVHEVQDALMESGESAALSAAEGRAVPLPDLPPRLRGRELENYLHRLRAFNATHDGDVFLDAKRFDLLRSALARFERIQKTIGFGNFYLLSFDEAVHLAQSRAEVGAFTVDELDFLEQIFYERALLYGFYGEKPMKNLTDQIDRSEVVKVPNSGNHLYRGKPLEMYTLLRRRVGSKLILTSGVRSVVKQFMLFLSKIHEGNGNLSRASRSLAPPGYSYHGISDFDVGQTGYGQHNFTEKFVESEVFKHLHAMGVLSLRYPRDNLTGVRFEPWHVKVDV
ncbi:M15 family metallopeptidase [Candidatus Magnetaquicoccus inordinatus]|uniref:M15 family metallopeptidase n=1 Tax=Candidatus Magnetaquicoccus inordinatus TaxID=2496818 RepID=UPI00187D30CF|nr:M15 family metallopeptidase [Candidatus Magnetaquicoccus inordinatus]